MDFKPLQNVNYFIMSICEREKDFAILISIQFVLFIFDIWTFSFKDDSLLTLKAGNKIHKNLIHVAIRRVGHLYDNI